MTDAVIWLAVTPFAAVAALFAAWLIAGASIEAEDDDPHKDPEHWGRS